MPSLPVPMVVSLVLLFLLLRGLRQGLAAGFVFLLGLCALQGVVLTARFATQWPQLQDFQVVLAAFIAPATFIVFETATRRPLRPFLDGGHLVFGACVVLFLLLFAPMAVDPFLNIWFVGHGLWILLILAGDADGLPLTRLEYGDRARRPWALSGAALILAGLVDLGIFLAIIAGYPQFVPMIVSLAAGVVLIGLALLSLHQAAMAPDLGPSVAMAEIKGDDLDPVEQADLMQRLHHYLTDRDAFRDPDLSLTRLARRLGVSAKRLSIAINRDTGESVSRLVNTYRVRAACADLELGQSVTQAMLRSGFNTKSNFNVEFRRVTGKSPRDLMKSAET